MIDLADAMKVLGQAVIASDLFPRILWPNRAALMERPFLAMELRSGLIRDPTLGLDAPTWTGELIATAVTEADTFDTEALAQIAALAALFPAGSRFTMASGGKLLIAGHPRPLPGYRDGSDFRLQLSIPIQSD